MKKVLILMAERTGTGHKSAAKAIQSRLEKYGHEVKQLNCFPLMGKTGNWMENVYIPLTINHPRLWTISYWFSQTFPGAIHRGVYPKVKEGLKKELLEYKPDVIVSVHSMFTRAVTKLIKKENLNIPVYTGVVDLVDPPHVWYDKNMDIYFVPTDEIREDYIKKGFDEKRIFTYGFPVRDDIALRKEPKVVKDKVNILLVNPSVDLKKNLMFAKEISRLENVTVNFICGRDEKLYTALKELQDKKELSKDINIHGFVTNMNEFLDNSHIILTKAGPNMMVEAIRSKTCVVVTGHIEGQENKNFEYVLKNELGIKCENPKKIYNELNELINSKKLDNCLKNLANFEIPNGADIIADYINTH